MLHSPAGDAAAARDEDADPRKRTAQAAACTDGAGSDRDGVTPLDRDSCSTGWLGRLLMWATRNNRP